MTTPLGDKKIGNFIPESSTAKPDRSPKMEIGGRARRTSSAAGRALPGAGTGTGQANEVKTPPIKPNPGAEKTVITEKTAEGMKNSAVKARKNAGPTESSAKQGVKYAKVDEDMAAKIDLGISRGLKLNITSNSQTLLEMRKLLTHIESKKEPSSSDKGFIEYAKENIPILESRIDRDKEQFREITGEYPQIKLSMNRERSDAKSKHPEPVVRARRSDAVSAGSDEVRYRKNAVSAGSDVQKEEVVKIGRRNAVGEDFKKVQGEIEGIKKSLAKDIEKMTETYNVDEIFALQEIIDGKNAKIAELEKRLK